MIMDEILYRKLGPNASETERMNLEIISVKEDL